MFSLKFLTGADDLSKQTGSPSSSLCIIHSIETQKKTSNRLELDLIVLRRSMQAQMISAFKDCFPGYQELVENILILQEESEALEVRAFYRLRKQCI